MDLKLDMNIDPEEFIHFYWPRNELSDFCLKHDLPGSVSRRELMERVYKYLRMNIGAKKSE